MLKKNITTIIVGLIMSGSVYSNNKLGMLKLNSTRHEPFDATITVKHKTGSDLKLMKAQLGSIVDFYRHNLEPSFLNSNLSFKVKDKNDQEKVIHITSEIPLSTEKFGFVVRLYDDDDEKSFGVYKFIPPVVDPMEDVEVFVCNSLNWDNNNDCMQKVNTVFSHNESKNKTDKKAELKISKKTDVSVPRDSNDFKYKGNIKEEPPLNKGKVLTKVRADKTKESQENNIEIEAGAKTPIKKVDTEAMKKEKTKLRRKLKPHMHSGSRKKLPDYPSTNASDVRDSLKPQISIKKNKQDAISKGIIKFSEILKLDPSSEEKK